MERPEIEEWDVNNDPVPNYNPSSEMITLGNRYKAVRDYALDLEDQLDLCRDEFKRILSCPGVDPEITGLAERGCMNITQHVHVITQRDDALTKVATLESQLKDEKESVNELSRHCQRLEVQLECKDCGRTDGHEEGCSGAVDWETATLSLKDQLKQAEGLLRKCIYQHVPKNIPLYHMIKEALKDLGKEDRMTDSIDPIVRSLRHTEEIIAQGPNGPAWPDISPHQIKAEVKP